MRLIIGRVLELCGVCRKAYALGNGRCHYCQQAKS